MLNRVERGDTLDAPVARAVNDAQAAYNAVVHEDPHEPRSKKSQQAIYRANSSAQGGYRDLQQTARERFAPLGLPDSRYTALFLLDVKKPGPRSNELLAALRAEPARHAKVVGPDKQGRTIVHDSEGAPGEAYGELVHSLDAAGDDWREHLELHPQPEAEVAAWEHRIRMRGAEADASRRRPLRLWLRRSKSPRAA